MPTMTVEYQRKYRQTESGKASVKRSTQKYHASEYGKAANKRRRKEYHSTIEGYLRSVFYGIRRRCTDPNLHNYHRYGGRGIKVCFERDEFINYVIYGLQIDPRGLQIDRIDNDGNYEKGNIRFVSRSENCQNRGSQK